MLALERVLHVGAPQLKTRITYHLCSTPACNSLLLPFHPRLHCNQQWHPDERLPRYPNATSRARAEL